ncbi:DUF4230 domain-containing protein [Tenacibaculum piscium]|uniref:DUF4230 domain-containing protein n=1 Tax=Tenacibaculum piscium TaxID=1458515 RepID=UPI001F1624A5|nr:DUF4230 domain-containing protein [Tenacibaculum piscium]
MKYIFIFLMIILLPIGYFIYKISTDKDVEIVETKTHITSIKTANTLYVSHINVDYFLNLGDIGAKDNSLVRILPYRVDAGYDLDKMKFVFKTNAGDSIVKVTDLSLLNTKINKDINCEIILPEIKIKINKTNDGLTVYEGKDTNELEAIIKQYKIFAQDYYVKTIAEKRGIEKKAQNNINEFFKSLGEKHGISYSIASNTIETPKEDGRFIFPDFPITFKTGNFNMGIVKYPIHDSKGDSLSCYGFYNNHLSGMLHRLYKTDEIIPYNNQSIKPVLFYNKSDKIKVSTNLSNGNNMMFDINVSGVSYQLSITGDNIMATMPKILDFVYSFEYNENYVKDYDGDYLGITKDMMLNSKASDISTTLKQSGYFYPYFNLYGANEFNAIYDTKYPFVVLLKDTEIDKNYIEEEIESLQNMNDPNINLNEAIAVLIDYDKWSKNEYYIFYQGGIYNTRSMAWDSKLISYNELNTTGASSLFPEGDNLNTFFEWLTTQGFISVFK